MLSRPPAVSWGWHAQAPAGGQPSPATPLTGDIKPAPPAVGNIAPPCPHLTVRASSWPRYEAHSSRSICTWFSGPPTSKSASVTCLQTGQQGGALSNQT